MIYFFSGTGNSRWVAERLASISGERVQDMAPVLQGAEPLLLPEREERVGFVLPVYAWAPPAAVRHFLHELCGWVDGASYCYAVLTCGDDTGRCAVLLRRMMRHSGMTLSAVFSVRMPNTYVCLPGFDVDADALRREKLAAAPARVAQIAKEVDSRASVQEVEEGRFPRFKSYVLHPLFRRFLMSDGAFRVTTDCKACGACVKACPMGNMDVWDDGTPRWRGRDCAMCLRCYHTCPYRAIRYGRRTERKGRYTLSSYIKEMETT